MSFEGYYQCICENGHYFEIDVNEERDKCVDCFSPIVFKNIVDETNSESLNCFNIPLDKSGNVDKKYFEKHFSNEFRKELYLERRKMLKPYVIEFSDEYSSDEIIDNFHYFNLRKTLKIEYRYEKDAGNDLVPYVFVSFGETKYTEDHKEEWQPLFIDKYGEEISEKEDNGYECTILCYDGDIRKCVIELYKEIYKRIFKYRFS